MAHPHGRHSELRATEVGLHRMKRHRPGPSLDRSNLHLPPRSRGQTKIGERRDSRILRVTIGVVPAGLSEYDFSIRRDNEDGWPGDTSGIRGIDHTHRLDSPAAIWITQDRERELEFVDQCSVLHWRVDRNNSNPSPGRGDLFVLVRQTDQLSVAVRSPIAPQKDDHLRGIEVGRKGPVAPCLVEKCEIRGLHESPPVVSQR